MKMEHEAEEIQEFDRDAIICRHKKEVRDLFAETQKIKHSIPKSDKRKRKEALERIAQLESALTDKHEEELKKFDASQNLAVNINDININGINVRDAENITVSKRVNKKLEKLQKRREKQKQDNVLREERIQQQEIENRTGSRHIEQEKICHKLKERGLVLHEIAADGNCLFSAVSHQLSQSSQQNVESCDTLRCKTAEYMASHVEQFIQFLINPDTNEPYTEEGYQEYCQNLSSKPVWGGQPEILALTCVLQRPIIVIQSDCADITVGEDLPTHGSPLTIVYHRHIYRLGEHYNSVLPVSATLTNDAEFHQD